MSSNTIVGFDTISKHQAKLRQPAMVIRCFVDVLNYINQNLSDDNSQSLLALINSHLGDAGLAAHYLNQDDLSEQLLQSLQQSFSADNPEYSLQNLSSTQFLRWLYSSSNIYSGTVPSTPDDITTGLDLAAFQSWFDTNHDYSLTAHENTIVAGIAEFMVSCRALPIFWLGSSNFLGSSYAIIGDSACNTVMNLVTAFLLTKGSPTVIDYSSDTGTPAFLSEYGETDELIIDKKFTDYYSNQLAFVINSSMTSDYKTVLTNLRQDINSDYSKVYNIYTVIQKDNYAIQATIDIGMLSPKTLDLINLVGLSKSLFCLCTTPNLVNGVLTNNVVASFDNYNPAFTTTIVSGISSGGSLSFDIVISASSTELNVYTVINGVYNKTSIPNVGKMFDIFPYFLFVPPRVADYQASTIRLRDLRLFGKSLNDNDAIALIAGRDDSTLGGI